MTSPNTLAPPYLDAETATTDKSSTLMSTSSNSSSSLSTSLDNNNNNTHTSPTMNITSTAATSTTHSPPNPTRSLSATTPTIRSPPIGGGSQTKRHNVRSQSIPSSNKALPFLPPPSSPPPLLHSSSRQLSSSNLDRSVSQPPQQRPTSPITSPSINKSLHALDAKSITRDMEKSATLQLRGVINSGASTEDIIVVSPSSPTHSAHNNSHNFYFGNNNNNMMSFQSLATPSAATAAATAATTSPNYLQYHRQNSLSSVTLLPPTTPLQHPTAATAATSALPTTTVQGDAWQTLCVRVLPLFNGEGVQGAIEDLNDLLRRCLSDSISLTFYHDIEALLRDGMFTLNAKMFGVTDEKLLDRLVEQWSFFFTYALPYFEAVFLPLRTDVRYRSPEEAEMWNVRNMALRSFRDNVILLQTKRLEDVFNKLFTDFGSSQNPAATAAKMLQMTSLLASSPDHNEDIERVLSNLKANWKIMMTKGDRRGFAGVRKKGQAYRE